MDKDWYKPYDSPEELYVSWYLDELGEAEYLWSYDFQPVSFNLSLDVRYEWQQIMKTKTKSMSSALLQKHVYTPDFKVHWADKSIGLFIKSIKFVTINKSAPFWINNSGESIWEVKPSFDRNNMTRLFTINQKWVYDKYGIYVQKIIPWKLFAETFTPEKYLLTDSGKQKRKLIFTPRTLEEYVESRRG